MQQFGIERAGMARRMRYISATVTMADRDPSNSTLRILVVDDEANIRLTLGMCLEAEGHTVVSHGNIHDALEEISRRVFDLVFLDVRLGMDNGLEFLPILRAESPWAQVIVITAFASIETAVEAMKKGATDYLPKPFEPMQVQLLTRKVAERRQLELKLQALQLAMGSMDVEADLPTNSPAMRDAIELARQVAPSKAALLIRGEVGVGKGRLARAIHAWSKRSEAPFASVSCAAEGDALEAELFGQSPGHALGNGETPGRAAFCDGGTLFLDEVGQIPARLQTKLLRLIRDREYERVEETNPRQADVRIIASTSVDLQEAVKAGTFRADLLMSLDVVEIAVPALRNRPEDIPLLAERYLAMFRAQNRAHAVGITSDALFAMNKYSWPGNIRELRNVIERAVLLCRSEKIGIEHLPPNLLNSEPAYAVGDLVPLEIIEKNHVLQVVASTRSLRRAASILGVDSSTLCRWMKRYGVRDDQPAA
jgi:two-component system, NtrC family, response regulator AlgB